MLPSAPTLRPAANFACPVCTLPLLAEGQALRCGNSHSFDLARKYVNLLVVQHKASRDPGDTAGMVKARRRLLESGIYAPIADAVSAHVQALARARTAAGHTYRILDAGCGEGYYLAAMAQALAGLGAAIELAGTDVSKWAVREAAKRPVPAAWAVANNRYLPFVAGSVDLIVCLFGFPVWEGFRAVQPGGGRVVLVDPGPEHLAELRAIIYPTVNRAEPSSLTSAETAGYALEATVAVTYRAELASQAQIADLFAMTPHAHRAPQAGRAALATLDSLEVTVDVVVRTLRRE
jgi:23S rRNA (guanine745-N1)-methyltransferase